MSREIEEFKAALKHLIADKGEGKQSLADGIGVSLRYIQQISSQKSYKHVSTDIMYKISKYFGLEYREMISMGRDILSGGSLKKTLVRETTELTEMISTIAMSKTYRPAIESVAAALNKAVSNENKVGMLEEELKELKTELRELRRLLASLLEQTPEVKKRDAA